MYLLVFVTLMISIVGIYTQVLTLQTARMYAHQSAIAKEMLVWHAGAISMAASIIKTSPGYPGAVAARGCSLSWTLPVGINPAITHCPSPQKAGVDINLPATGGGTLTTGGAARIVNLIYNTKTLQNECAHLPTFGACSAVYDVQNYEFYSLLYQDPVSNQNLVVTFLPAPTVSAVNPPPGYLAMPNGLLTSVSSTDLIQQLKNAAMPVYAYGTINGANQMKINGNLYNLPVGFATITNANGAVGVLGSPDNF